MAKAKEFEFERALPVSDDEDEATLAAIDKGIADAKANRTVPIAECPEASTQVDYRILFTQEALRHLAEIIGYIAEDDDEAASRFGGTLLDHVELLTRYPRMGSRLESVRAYVSSCAVQSWFTIRFVKRGSSSKSSTSVMGLENRQNSRVS